MANGKIKTAVITGEHEYDVVGFQSMLRSLPEIEAYPQNLWDFVFDSARGPGTYDVLVFFNWHQSTPAEKDGKSEPGTSKQSGAIKEMLEGLADGGQGIFLLHHALVAFPDWPPWRELSGMRHARRNTVRLRPDRAHRRRGHRTSHHFIHWSRGTSSTRPIT